MRHIQIFTLCYSLLYSNSIFPTDRISCNIELKQNKIVDSTKLEIPTRIDQSDGHLQKIFLENSCAVMFINPAIDESNGDFSVHVELYNKNEKCIYDTTHKLGEINFDAGENKTVSNFSFEGVKYSLSCSYGLVEEDNLISYDGDALPDLTKELEESVSNILSVIENYSSEVKSNLDKYRPVFIQNNKLFNTLFTIVALSSIPVNITSILLTLPPAVEISIIVFNAIYISTFLMRSIIPRFVSKSSAHKNLCYRIRNTKESETR